jgi:hypothetical protein
MFGNTRLVAEAIGRGLASAAEVAVVPVREATADVLEGANLVVAGGPTHLHRMSRARSRRMAGALARKPGSPLVLEPGAEGPGLREWIPVLGPVTVAAAAFDTRAQGVPLFTGRASKGISKALRRRGLRIVAKPESFIVAGKDTHLVVGEVNRATDWGRRIAARVLASDSANANGPGRPTPSKET